MIHSGRLKGKHVQIVGIDLWDRVDLFSVYMMKDIVYYIVAMVIILVIAGLYTKSVILIVFTMLNVIFSFGLAYFVYFIVFQIPHLPFMSLLAFLLLIAVGVDDVFIFSDTFEQIKQANPDGDLVDWISHTMRHAALSILVTSLTTAAALYANIISEITDIKGFGIIAGTALVINYLLMITWIPAGFVAVEKAKVISKKFKCNIPEWIKKIQAFQTYFTTMIFHEVLPCLVKKLWLLWILLFLGLGIGGIVVTFVKPKLDLPKSQDFALFQKNRPIEVWFQKLKYKFRYFQRQKEIYMGGGLNVVAVWGLDGKDTGNYLDPDSKSKFKLDHSFDMSHPDAQTWLLKFCKDTKNASFVSNVAENNLECVLDLFNNFTTQSCDIFQSNLNTKLHQCHPRGPEYHRLLWPFKVPGFPGQVPQMLLSF